MMNHPYGYGYGYGLGYIPPYYAGGYGYNVVGGYGMNGYYDGLGYYPYSTAGYAFACFFTLLMTFIVVYVLAVIFIALWRIAIDDDFILDDDD